MQIHSRKATNWLLLAVFLLLVTFGAVYKSFMQFDHHKDRVSHTYEMINILEDVISDLKDVQSSQRGYVITGLVDYLAPYSVALPRIETNLEKLRVGVADNPDQEKNLSVLKDEAEKRIAIAADIIEAYEKQGQDKAFAMVKSGAGKKEMDQIRAKAGEMIGLEHNLLNRRQQQLDDAAWLTLALGGIAVLVCLGIFVSVFTLLERENRGREVAEETLSKALLEITAAAEQDGRISQMTDYLQSSRSVDEAYAVIGKAAPQFLDGTTGGIFMFDTNRDFLETAAHWGTEHAPLGFTADQCWALRRGQTHYMHPDGSEPICQHIGILPAGGAACYPMQAHGETLGCFHVAAAKENSLNDRSHKAVRRASEQIALALSNLRLQGRLRDQSTHDPLTGLFNRRYLEEAAQRELQAASRGNTPLGVLVLDIDHFKKYNDTRGHDAGDALLAQFSKLVHKKIRDTDIACRYGGEEFVVLLPGASLEQAVKRAEVIRAATQEMQVHSGKEQFSGVTVSIGVSAYPQHGDKLEELVTASDKALYAAKQGGRNQVKAA